jgi:hypothetical protein
VLGTGLVITGLFKIKLTIKGTAKSLRGIYIFISPLPLFNSYMVNEQVADYNN